MLGMWPDMWATGTFEQLCLDIWCKSCDNIVLYKWKTKIIQQEVVIKSVVQHKFSYSASRVWTPYIGLYQNIFHGWRLSAHFFNIFKTHETHPFLWDAYRRFIVYMHIRNIKPISLIVFEKIVPLYFCNNKGICSNWLSTYIVGRDPWTPTSAL